MLINTRFYTRAQVNASQTLLAQVSPASCVTGAAGSRVPVSTCFATTPFATDWRAANGQTLATLTSLAADSQAVRLMIGDSGATITGSSKGIDGAMNGVTLDARIFYVNDAANTVLADLLFDYRGLQTSFARYNAYEASVDTTEPTFAEIVGRPVLANPVPVQMTTLNL